MAIDSTQPVLFEGARCFDGSRLLDGAADVLVEGGRIAWVGAGACADRRTRRIDARGSTLMPGLIDLHMHLEMPDVPDRTGYLARTSPALMAFQAAHSARVTMEAGFTTLRNMGSTACVAVRQAFERDLLVGPRLLTSGIVDMTGGHFDLLVPLQIARDPLATADGDANVRQLVRRHVRAGVDFIKFATTGGIASEGDEPDWQTFSAEEIRAIIEEAHALKRQVACHAQGAEGIKTALRAGVDTLEHGTFMDDEGLALLLQSRAVLVPTLSFFHGVMTRGRELGLPEHWLRKCGPAYEAARHTVRRAHAAGARIAYGTDSASRQAPHGRNAGEIGLLVGLGFTPLEALVAATSAAAQAVGLDSETGAVRAGLSADLLLVDGDPLDDVALLADPMRIRMVVSRGRVVVDH